MSYFSIFFVTLKQYVVLKSEHNYYIFQREHVPQLKNTAQYSMIFMLQDNLLYSDFRNRIGDNSEYADELNGLVPDYIRNQRFDADELRERIIYQSDNIKDCLNILKEKIS